MADLVCNCVEVLFSRCEASPFARWVPAVIYNTFMRYAAENRCSPMSTGAKRSGGDHERPEPRLPISARW